MSPFEVTYDCPPPPLFDVDFTPTLKATTDYHESHMEVINTLKLNLDRAKKHMKTQADKGKTDVQF